MVIEIPEDVEFVSIKEFVKRNPEMSESSLSAACRRNEMPHVRLGRRVYIPENALAIMYEQQQSELRKKFAR